MYKDLLSLEFHSIFYTEDLLIIHALLVKGEGLIFEYFYAFIEIVFFNYVKIKLFIKIIIKMVIGTR